AARLPVGAPPVLDFTDDPRGIAPAEDGEAEGGFRDEGMTAKGLEGRAGGVGGEFVVARDHPDFAVAFDSNLGRAEDVSRWMEGDGHGSEADGSAVGLG